MIASSRSSTIFIDKIKSKYSVCQSSKLALCFIPNSNDLSSPIYLTSFELNRGIAFLRKTGAISLWTNKVSIALHAAGY